MNFLLILTFAFLYSCSTTLDFHMPTQNFSSPEVVGKSLGLRGQGTLSNSTKFKVATLETFDLFGGGGGADISTEQGSSKDNVLQAQFGIGIGTALELHYKAYTDSPDLLGFKLQVLGRDKGEKKKGVKLTIHAGYGIGEDDENDINAVNTTYTADMEVEGLEAGIALGYRVNDTFLPYIAYNHRTYKVDADLASPGFTAQKIKEDAEVNSYQLGVKVSSGEFYLMLEAGFAQSIWSNRRDRDDYSIGGALGFELDFLKRIKL